MKEHTIKNKQQDILLENIDTQIWYLKDKYTYGKVNSSHAEFLGFNKEDIENKRFESFLDKDNAEICKKSTKEVFEKKKKVITEEWATDSKGNKRFLSITKTPVFDDNGDIEYVVASAEDITEQKRQQQKTTETKKILEDLANQVPGALYQYRFYPENESSYFPYTSDGIYEIFEVKPEEVIEDASIVFDRIHADDYHDVMEKIRNSAALLKVWKNTFRVVLPKQGLKWVEGNAKPEKMEDGSILWHGNIRDITEEKRRENEMNKIKERLELAVEGGNIGVWDWNVETEEVYYNKHWANMIGYEEGELDYKISSWKNLVHPDDIKSVNAEVSKLLEGKIKTYKTEQRLKTKEGRWKWIRDIGKVSEQDHNGKAVRVVGVHIDIDKEKRAQEKIKYLSNHDNLTGLYNNRYFNEEINRLVNSRQYPISIIIGDLDNLKIVNDSYGHQIGDYYLKEAANILNNAFRNEDVVSRIGGDEFAIILPNTDENSVLRMCSRVKNKFEETKKDNQDLNLLSISLGSCTMENKSVNFKEAYRIADKRMYYSKSN